MERIRAWSDDNCLATGEGTAEKISEFPPTNLSAWKFENLFSVPWLIFKTPSLGDRATFKFIVNRWAWEQVPSKVGGSGNQPFKRESSVFIAGDVGASFLLWCVTYFTVSTNNNVILRFCLTNPRKNPTCSLYISACAHIALWSRVSLQMRRSVVAGEKDLPALQGKYYRLVKVKLSVLITHERLNTGRLPWQSAFRARCFCWTETCFRQSWLRSRRKRFFAVFARVAYHVVWNRERKSTSWNGLLTLP